MSHQKKTGKNKHFDIVSFVKDFEDVKEKLQSHLNTLEAFTRGDTNNQ
jgi:hypothetical protein